MKNKNFVSVLTIMFILFVAVFGSAGCGGGHSSLFAKNNPDDSRTYFTVTFDSNGGSVVAKQTVKEGKKLLNLLPLLKTPISLEAGIRTLL